MLEMIKKTPVLPGENTGLPPSRRHLLAPFHASERTPTLIHRQEDLTHA